MYWKGNYVMYITLFKYIYLLDLWPYFVNGLYRTTVGEDASIGSCLIIWATQLNYLSKSSTQTIHHGQGSHLIIEFPVACWETKRQGQYRKTVPALTEKGSNLCDYRKMVESGRVPGKGRIRTGIQKTVPASTRKGSNLFEYRKMVESGRVPGICRIRASIEKLSRRVPKKGLISVGTEKW